MNFTVAILHKVFWTIISFFLFYVLLKNFVLKKIIDQKESQEKFINDLFNEINLKDAKIKDFIFKTKQINEIEIPQNKNHYIEKKINALISDHEIKINDEMNFLMNKLKKQTNLKIDLSKINVEEEVKKLIERLQQ